MSKDDEQIKRMREQQARERASKDLATRRAAKAREEATKRDRERQQKEKKARQDREAIAAYDRQQKADKRCGQKFTVKRGGSTFTKFCTRKPHTFGKHR